MNDPAPRFRPAFALLAATFLYVGLASLSAQVHDGAQIVDANLVASVDSVVPGRPFLAGLHLKMAPHWHTYWQNPGDAGLPASIEWTLPEGFRVADFQWPAPRRMEEGGGLVSYGYENEVLLLFEISPPAQIGDTSLTLRGKASWLVCKEICIPGDAELALTLPVAAEGSTPGPANAALFAKFEQRLPRALPEGSNVEWSRVPDAKTVRLAIKLPAGERVADFFPLPDKGLQIGAVQRGDGGDPGAVALFDIALSGVTDPGAPATLGGVLTAESANGDIAVHAIPPIDLNELADGAGSPAAVNGSGSGFVELGGGSGEIGLGLALFYALLGGLILNLMPCVLPAISLKIFGFVEQAGESRARIFGFGLAFVAGIFVWFGLMALLAVGLKLGGLDLNWGFLFQHPWALVAMGAVVLVFALNLFGVFEIVLPGSAHNAIAGAARQKGYAGSFAHGMFATILATPCTAPYLGAALGFAFTQPPWIIPAIFFAIALGMSFPYLLLAVNPGWLAWLPKPGAWMERFKQFMGFLLLAVLVWLVWVLGRQRGPDAAAAALLVYLFVGLLCWIGGAAFGPVASAGAKRLGLAATLLVVGGLAWSGMVWAQPAFEGRIAGSNNTARVARPAAVTGEIAWEPFGKAHLDALLKETNDPVFVDFTADWCWTCKVNERTVLANQEVRLAFEESGVRMLQADWTDGDPEITAALKSFRRVGVPLYVFYPADRTQPPIVLPELITPAIVLEGIRRASDERSEGEFRSVPVDGSPAVTINNPTKSNT